MKLDEGQHRAWFAVLPVAQTRTIASILLEQISLRPNLASWDWLIDIRNTHIQSSRNELEELVAAANVPTRELRYTIFITPDAASYEWCALLGRRFRYRRHLVAASATDAVKLLPRATPSI